MRKRLLFAVLLLFLVTPVSAHLCHDPFRPQEHLVLVPEKDLITIEEAGEFRMYIENTFRSTLQDVQLFVESPAFEVKVEPEVLERLVPGERSFFLVKLKIKEGFKPGDYPLRISVGARSAELRPSIERIDVVVDKKVPEPKVEPVPQIKPEEVRQEENVPEEKEPEVQVKEVRPPEREEKIVSPEKKPQPVEEVKLPEKVVEPQEVGEVVVKVEKIPLWKSPYFYIAFILLLVVILIWRKIKIR